MVRQYLVTIIGIIGLLTVLSWGIDSINYCEETEYSADCLTSAFKEHPQIKDATNLAEACENPDEKCFTEIGKKVLFKKFEQKVKENEN